MVNTYFEKMRQGYITAGVFKCTFIVPEFEKLFRDDYSEQNVISSSVYYTGHNRTIGWSLNLSRQSRNDHTDNPDIMILHIKHSVSYNTPYTVGSNKALYVLNNEGDEIKLVDRFMEGVDSDSYDWDEYWFSRKPMIANPKVFLPGDKLRLMCYVHVHLPMPLSKQIKISKQEKLSYFANFVENDEFSDVTITVKGREFRAHKIFLSARSPVFAAMFRHEMKEKRENRVKIDDIEGDIFKALLQYIYTNEVTNIDDIAVELLVVADKYEVNDLKELCEKTLSKFVTNSTAKEILFIADRFNANLLMKYIDDFLQVINPPPVKHKPIGRVLCD